MVDSPFFLLSNALHIFFIFSLSLRNDLKSSYTMLALSSERLLKFILINIVGFFEKSTTDAFDVTNMSPRLQSSSISFGNTTFLTLDAILLRKKYVDCMVIFQSHSHGRIWKEENSYLKYIILIRLKRNSRTRRKRKTMFRISSHNYNKYQSNHKKVGFFCLFLLKTYILVENKQKKCVR